MAAGSLLGIDYEDLTERRYLVSTLPRLALAVTAFLLVEIFLLRRQHYIWASWLLGVLELADLFLLPALKTSFTLLILWTWTGPLDHRKCDLLFVALIPTFLLIRPVTHAALVCDAIVVAHRDVASGEAVIAGWFRPGYRGLNIDPVTGFPMESPYLCSQTGYIAKYTNPYYPYFVEYFLNGSVAPGYESAKGAPTIDAAVKALVYDRSQAQVAKGHRLNILDMVPDESCEVELSGERSNWEHELSSRPVAPYGPDFLILGTGHCGVDVLEAQTYERGCRASIFNRATQRYLGRYVILGEDARSLVLEQPSGWVTK